MSGKNSALENQPIISQSIDPVDVNHLGVRSRGSRRRVSSNVLGESQTMQADHDRACIHCLLDRYKKTGHIPQVVAQPLTGEVPDVETFHQAMNIVVNAQQTFEALPVSLREKFKHDPRNMLAFVTDEKNKSELVELGLAKRPDGQEGEGAMPPPAPSPQRAQHAGEGEGAAPEGGK